MIQGDQEFSYQLIFILKHIIQFLQSKYIKSLNLKIVGALHIQEAGCQMYPWEIIHKFLQILQFIN